MIKDDSEREKILTNILKEKDKINGEQKNIITEVCNGFSDKAIEDVLKEYRDLNQPLDNIIEEIKNKDELYKKNTNRDFVKSEICKLRRKTPNQLIKEGWEDTTHPDMTKKTSSRNLHNPITGMDIRYDKGVPGANRFEGIDHYHVHNHNHTSKKDLYLDIDGNPVRRGSRASHIIIEGE